MRSQRVACAVVVVECELAIVVCLGGRAAAARSISGAVIGHLWWFGVWDGGLLRRLGTAPAWVRNLIGGGRDPGAGGAGGGVHVVPPRRVRDETQPVGHSWGTGQRLGT